MQYYLGIFAVMTMDDDRDVLSSIMVSLVTPDELVLATQLVLVHDMWFRRVLSEHDRTVLDDLLEHDFNFDGRVSAERDHIGIRRLIPFGRKSAMLRRVQDVIDEQHLMPQRCWQSDFPQ